MSLTITEAENLVVALQREHSIASSTNFWNKYPEHRRGLSLEEYLAESAGEDEEDASESGVNWYEVPTGEIDGHSIELIEDVGGEGQGEYAHVVFKVDDQYFKHVGYYASYDGTYWDDYETEEVEPHEVTVTKYRKVK